MLLVLILFVNRSLKDKLGYNMVEQTFNFYFGHN